MTDKQKWTYARNGKPIPSVSERSNGKPLPQVANVRPPPPPPPAKKKG